MRLWCDRCCEAVDADSHKERETMDISVPGGVWEYTVYTCPYCGSEVHEEPDHCTRCGEEIPPGDRMCDCCHDDMYGVITTLQDDGKYSKKEVLEHLDVFLEEEM